MNRIFNVIWSITKEKWVVVSEKVKSNGGVPKSSLLSIAVLSSIFAAGVPAYAIDSGALPAGGQITAGAGSIGSSGARMTVNQASQQMIANWSSFNIGTDASVQFIQPNVSATVLNRIADQNPSQILGSLSANGKVFLLNQSGIIFGKNARVDVGGLVASSLNMLDSDFLASKYKFFASDNAGQILNQGSINAQGGVVALIAPKVTNEGAITARSGSVAFGAGNQVSVDFTGDGLITLTVDQGVIDALVENKGLVKADGGLVVMTARAADELSKSTVNNSGIIEANTLQQQGGRILLDAVGGMTTVSGTLDASSADGKGGQVVATGDRVLVKDGAHLTASGATGGGEVLVGGNWQGKDTSIHQATGTIVEPGALLEANATDTGNGGTVVAWSDVTNSLSVTRAYGTFEAKGGPHGGDGGRIETSGHWLDVAGSQGGASASHGQGGLWLFDPYDVTISLNPSVFDPGVLVGSDWKWTSNESGTVISVVSITFNLTSGTNVTIETGGNVLVDFGTIKLDTPIFDDLLLPFNATLKLSANGSIELNQDISTVGRLNLEFDTVKGGVSGTGNISGYGDTIFKIGGNSTYTGTISDGVSLIGSPLVRTLTKDGAGILTLTATNNYTGTTTINAGAIRVSGATAALGDTVNGGAPVTVASGAVLELDNATLSNHLDLKGTLSSYSGQNNKYGGDISLFGSPVINADSGTTLTLSYVDGGGNSNGDLTVSGGGTVVFDGAIGSEIPIASFTGNTETTLVINGGWLSTSGAQTFHGPTTFGYVVGNVAETSLLTTDSDISADGKVTANGVLLILDTGLGDIKLDNVSNDFSTVQVTLANTVTLIDSNELILSGIDATGLISVVTKTGNLTVEGNISSSDNSAKAIQLYAGEGCDIVINVGMIHVGNYGVATLSADGSIHLNTYISNSDSSNLNLVFNTVNGGVLGSGNIGGNDGSVIFNIGGNSTYEGLISGFGKTLTKTGNGALTLSGTNTYSGPTTINEGTLSIVDDSGLGTAPTVLVPGQLVINNGTLETTETFVLSSNRGIDLIDSGTISTVGSTTTLTYGGIMTGSGGLTKVGTGTLTLSGTNTYSGPTTINEGTLSIADDSGLGTAPTVLAPGQLVINNGTLETTETFVLSSNRGIDLIDSGTISTVGSTTTLTYGGIMTGSGGLTKVGTGTLTLSGTNTYSGPTTINEGTLSIADDSGLGTAPTVLAPGQLVINNGTLETTETFVLSSNRGIDLIDSGTISTVGSTTTLTYGGIMTGSGGLTKVGTGTLTLSGTNTYSGPTTINEGTLSIADDSGLGTAPTVLAPGQLVINNGTLETTETFVLSSNRGIDLIDSGTISTVGSTTTLTYGGIMTGSGGLTKVGTGTLTLSGTNTYSGPTTINEGTLSIADDSGLGTAPTVLAPGQLVINNGTLETTETFVLSSNRGIDLIDSGTISTVGSTTTLTYGGIMTGSGGLTKVGTGTLTLSGTNTYSGPTTINEGTLSIADDSGLGTAPTVLAPGQLVINNGTLETTETFVLSSNRGIDLIDSGTISTVGSTTTLTYGGIISGSGGLTKVGTGTLTLSGTNTYSGPTTINEGTLLSGKKDVIGDYSAVSIDSGAIWNLDGYYETVGSIAGSGNIMLGNNGYLIFGTDSNDTIYGGIISGSGGLTKVGTGTLTLSGKNTYTGPTMITGGLLISGDNEVIPNQSVLYIGSGTTWNLSYYTETVGSIYGSGDITLDGNLTIGVDATSTTYGGIISGSGSLTKVGAGRLTLTGANTYNGPTSINGGTIRVSPNSALGNVNSSAWVEVYSGGALELDNVTIGNKDLYLTNNNVSSPSPALRSVNGTSTYGGDIYLSGASIISADSGTLILSNPVYSLYGLSNQYSSCDLTVSGNGSVIFQGSIGNQAFVPGQDTMTIPLDSLTGEAGTELVINGSAVTTSGAQTYHDVLLLGEDTALAGKDITFDSEVKSSAGNYSLTVSDSGTTTFGGSVGGTVGVVEELLSLFIKSDGGTVINGGSVRTTGTQTYNDLVTLGANTTMTGTDITFVSEVKSTGGNHSLTVIDSGKTIFRAAVGGTVGGGEELLSLETSGTDPVLYGSVTTIGAQTYHDIVTLANNIILTGNGITFDTEVRSSDGYVSLTVNDSGATFFGGAVGGINSGEELSSLNVFSSGGTTINGGSVRTIGAQTYNNSTIFAAGTTLSTMNNNITAIGSVTATGLLTLDAGIGNVTFNNPSNDFSTVLVTSAGTLSLIDSNALAISGIQATGPVSVVTNTGDLTVDGDIYTSDASALAIQLNAGKEMAAGTATGGNIVINSGTISVGTGGSATLYTGSVSGSTNLSNLIESGHFRYNSNAGEANYSKSLTPGLNAIYREQPVVTVTITYGPSENGLPPVVTSVTVTGLQNNDNITDLASLGYASSVVISTDNRKSLPDVYIDPRIYEELLNPSYTAPPDDPVTGDVVSVINLPGPELVYDLETGDAGYLLDAPGTVIVGDLSMGYVVNMPASGVISGIGPLTKVGVGPLAQPSRINTFGGGQTITGAAPGIGGERGGITAATPGIGPGRTAGAASRDANPNAAYSDLIHKILVTGGSLIILASGALLLSRTRRFSQKTTFGKHANVYAHIHHGYQNLNTDILPKDLAGKREVSVRIQHDTGIQEVQVRGGSLVNSD